jgi:hypothetical protein
VYFTATGGIGGVASSGDGLERHFAKLTAP